MKIAMLGAKAVPCPGGIQTYIEQIGSRLAQRGHEVTVYCRRHYLGEEWTAEQPDYLGMRRVVTRGLRGKHTDALSHLLTSVAHAKRQPYDVIHIHGSAPSAVCPFLMKGPAAVAVTIHALDWMGPKWGLLARRVMQSAARTPLSTADAISVVSRHLEDYYRDQYGFRVSYIPTGVNLPQLLPPDMITRQLGLIGGDYILFAGRITQEKGLEYLLEAYRDLRTDKKLVIAGGVNHEDGYCRDLLSHESSQIIFPGFAHGQLLAELFSNAYLYVQPSVLEGMPLTVLEALSYGRCVVASDIPGISEALNGCGFRFPARDVASLRDTLDRLLEDEMAVIRQAEPARKYVQREHNWDLAVDQFEQFYHAAIAAKAAQRGLAAQQGGGRIAPSGSASSRT